MELEYCSVAEAGNTEADAYVVIDVLRAFTTAACVLSQGAQQILQSADDERTADFKEEFPDSLAIGDGRPRAGFDLPNSPMVVSGFDFTGQTVIQQTTNGTVGALACPPGRPVLCAAFANISATAQAVRRLAPQRLALVITGGDGTADEDLACAQMLGGLCAPDQPRPTLPDVQRRIRESEAAAVLQAGIESGFVGVHPQDVEFCARPDQFRFAMSFDGHALTVLR